MDKRWLVIILIFIIGAGGLYYIVGSSDTVGKAVTVCDEMTITLPSGFNILHKNTANITLLNHQNETLFIKIIGMDTNSHDEYLNRLDLLKENSAIEIEKTDDNNEYHSIYYENIDTGNKSVVCFFDKDNRTIEVKMHQYPGFEDDLNFTIETITHNFKQNKEMEGNFL